MKGFSVFARPQTCEQVIGLKVDQIQPERIFPKDKKSQFALKLQFHRYIETKYLTMKIFSFN